MVGLRQHGFIDVPVVGITGRKQSGKNWFANVLATAFNDIGYKTSQVSFAAPIKAACNAIFGWDVESLESEGFKNTFDPEFNITPRRAMQLMGTEFGRDMVNDSIWVDIALRKVYENHRRGRITIITDVRFDNECELLSRTGGKLVQVVNPLQPPARLDHVSESGVSYTPDFVYNNAFDPGSFGSCPEESYEGALESARMFVGSIIRG